MTLKTFIESMIMDILESEIDVEPVLKDVASEINKKYGLETSLSKSTIGKTPSFFLKVFGPKSTWTNNIALNSPVTMTIRVSDNKIDMISNSYQIRNAKAKMRATRFKSEEDLKKKLLAYFSKNALKFKEILGESLSEGYRVTANDMYDNSRFKSGVKETEREAKAFASRLKRAKDKKGFPMYSDVKVVKESLEESRDQKLRNHALKAAHPFGGAAEPSQEKLLDALEKEGFIEVTSYDPLDNSIFYELTAKGKAHVKSMKESLDESKFNDYKVMVDGKHIMTVNAKDEDQAYKIVDGQLQHLRKFVGKASPAVKDLKIKKWSGRLPEYDNIDMVKESLNESDYKVMHRTFTSAVNTAKEKAEKAGYTIDDDEWFRKVSSGPRKPGTDKTNRYSIELLTKKGNPARKHLHFQVYNTGGSYELNAYIN